MKQFQQQLKTNDILGKIIFCAKRKINIFLAFAISQQVIGKTAWSCLINTLWVGEGEIDQTNQQISPQKRLSDGMLLRLQLYTNKPGIDSFPLLEKSFIPSKRVSAVYSCSCFEKNRTKFSQHNDKTVRLFILCLTHVNRDLAREIKSSKGI